MAYDEFLADRVKNVLNEKRISFEARKMMGGLVFFVDEKMLCTIRIDKKYSDSLLMVRIGVAASEIEIHNPVCLPMTFTGRSLKGFIYVTPDGFDMDKDLHYWITLCLKFNPFAKKSKKKSKKK